MTEIEYPEKYWHCYVTLPGPKKEARRGVVNDLSFTNLKREIIDPWKQGARFAVSGTVVSDKTTLSEIRIVHTPYPKQTYSDEHYAGMRASRIADLATDTRFLPFGRGTDYTNQLLFASEMAAPPLPNVALLLQLCERLPYAARILAARRQRKAPYQIAMSMMCKTCSMA